MKNKRNALYGLAIIMVGLVYYTVQAQQKNGSHRASFAGEWKAKESIAMGGNIVCSYSPGDRMLAKTMKIAEKENLLTVAVSSSFPDGAPVMGREQLTLDGKAVEIKHGPAKVKEFTVKLSGDRQTMTINSAVSLLVGQKKQLVYTTEVWKLSEDGQSISVQTNARSSLIGPARSWKTTFEKVAWYSGT